MAKQGGGPVLTCILTGVGPLRKLAIVKSQLHNEGDRPCRLGCSWFEGAGMVVQWMCLAGISKVTSSGEHFIVPSSFHRRSLPSSDKENWGQMVNEWSREKGPISTCILLMNSTGII